MHRERPQRVGTARRRAVDHLVPAPSARRQSSYYATHVGSSPFLFYARYGCKTGSNDLYRISDRDR